jgi:5-(carboxyamino)imidazole ribonucleotide synthase
MRKQIEPGATIGILGEGQLGKMLALAAARMGYKTHVYGQNKEGCAFGVSTHQTIAEYSDTQALQTFAESVDVITIETENIDTSCFGTIPGKLFPQLGNIKIAANRAQEKHVARRLGIPTVRYHATKDIPKDFPFPGFLKTITGGFDGRGQILCENMKDVWDGYEKFGNTPSILEEKLENITEYSVAVARNQSGEIALYPYVKNKHHIGILCETVFDVHEMRYMEKINSIARQIVEEYTFVGLLVIEFFEAAGVVYFNEMAPRPHNSYHWTIEGCDISQFEMLVRAICNLPLRNPQPNAKKVVMKNILHEYKDEEAVLKTPHAHLHLYGKKPNPQGPRKIGHITQVIL